ncbi:uncharacterized protein LOC142328028 [Lycorma delicatula]|uniref:uncharacterized protein LOC142328028 n=1 Tax=Lycorma delicatula TaxID=130591 RepID=UPI003F519843
MARNFLLIIALVILQDVLGVQITDLRVPRSVKNGSTSVLLDCEYTLRPDETTTDAGLVVKWFFNKTPAPVYQWIPGKKPQELGILKGRLKLDHRASHHPATMHRALYILNPTTELAGEYKCAVSTFNDEDFMIKTMIVYVPERRLELLQRKPDLDSVNISCIAQGIYPEPRLLLYTEMKENQRVAVPGVKVQTTVRSGTFDVSANVLLSDEGLASPTVFSCELKIPNTEYVRKKNIVYYPGKMELECLSSECRGSISSLCLYAVLLATILLLIC